MNTNQQTVHQMGFGINEMVKQATGRESVSSIDMDWVSVEQLARYIYGSGSGDVVSFDTNIPDAIDSLIAYITAVQDLNGYDNPWPAGGGKNLFEAKMPTSSQSDVTCTNNGDGSFTFTGTASATVTFRLDQGSRVGSDNLKTYKPGTYYVSGLNGKKFVLQKTGEAIATLTGDGSFTLAEEKTEVYCYIQIASGDDSAGTVKPMIEIGTEASEWVPYENICPITGWTGCNVVRCGKNLFDGNATTQKYINSDGEEVTNASWSITDYIPVHAGGKIAYSGLTNVGTAPYSAFYGIDGKLISTFKQETGNNKTVNVPAAAKYVRFSISNSATQIKAFIVTTGTSTGDFEEYQGDVYAFTFPDEAGTVYGGTLDVLTGVLIVDRASIVFDATRTWTAHSSISNLYYTTITGMESPANQEERNTKIQCDIYPASSRIDLDASFPDKSMLRYSSSRLFIRDNNYSTATDFKEHMTNHQFVYPLATPATYQLTAQEVEALVGQNNIFADTGNVSVQYKVKEDLV